ncbi:hypothetical protein ABK040_007111 [Willaertia magna]
MTNESFTVRVLLTGSVPKDVIAKQLIIKDIHPNLSVKQLSKLIDEQFDKEFGHSDFLMKANKKLIQLGHFMQEDKKLKDYKMNGMNELYAIHAVYQTLLNSNQNSNQTEEEEYDEEKQNQERLNSNGNNSQRNVNPIAACCTIL